MLLAPLAASRPHGGAVVFGFAYGVYAIGSVICHQIPARSFHLWAAPMPVCARCTGIYLGAAFAAVILLGRDVRLPVPSVSEGKPDATRGQKRDVRLKPDTTRGPKRDVWLEMAALRLANVGLSNARILFVAAAIPTAATLVYEWTTGDTPANWIRALAGAPVGAAVAWIIREVN